MEVFHTSSEWSFCLPPIGTLKVGGFLSRLSKVPLKAVCPHFYLLPFLLLAIHSFLWNLNS